MQTPLLQVAKFRANIGPIFFLCSLVLILTPDLLCVVCIAPSLHPHTVMLPLYVYCTLCCLYVAALHEAKVITHASTSGLVDRPESVLGKIMH